MNRDPHAAALERSRKRAALAAWQQAVLVWHHEGRPRGMNEWQSNAAKTALSHFAIALKRADMGLDLTVGPAGTAEGW